MKRWAPCELEGWEETAELLTGTRKPWPEGMVVFDLRWHVATGQRIPGRPALRQRWNWSDWRVRKFLAEEARWRDKKAPLSSFHQNPPVFTSGDTVETKESEANLQLSPESTSFPPHARLKTTDTSTSTDTPPTPSEPPAEKSQPPPAKPGAKAVWEHWLSHQPESTKRRTKLTNDRRRKIQARLKEASADELKTLIDWAHRGSDPYARWLQGHNDRGEKYLGIETLMKPTKFGKRLDCSKQWRKPGNEPCSYAEAAWADLMSQPLWSSPLRSRPPGFHDGDPNQIADNREERERRKKAIRAAGGWSVWAECKDRALFREKFLRAYPPQKPSPKSKSPMRPSEGTQETSKAKAKPNHSLALWTSPDPRIRAGIMR